MKHFTVHSFEMMRKHYLLLPKLNDSQTRFATSVLVKRGLSVDARSATGLPKGGDGTVVHLDPEGFCWSAADITDHVLPIVPELVALPKERTSAKALWKKYLNVEVRPGGATIHPSTRVERGSLWKALRGSGLCGLTPDERTLIGLLFSKSERVNGLVTDFPTEGGEVKVVGHLQFYKSTLSGPEAARLLRSVDTRGTKNVYLPREGVLELERSASPSSREIAEAVVEMGEWCGFDLP
ncbi:MAG TPA: hypothetical protein VFE91_00670 [Nitrososphaerales archaeon]|nr:hypothetical protein [Nitrososphaerales archaeon]